MIIFASMNKAYWRTYFKRERKALTSSQRQQYDCLLERHLLNLNWDGVGVVHCFLPIARLYEINTLKLLNSLKISYPNLLIAVPKSDPQTLRMRAVEWEPTTILDENKWGIPEPIHTNWIDPLQISRILCPLLAYDFWGNRVGYGQGMYDQFLASCSPTVEKWGLSYFDPVPRIDDIFEGDVPLDGILHPKGYFPFPLSEKIWAT
jgi:5-formyltetrahydrofolate cyclo-ligase